MENKGYPMLSKRTLREQIADLLRDSILQAEIVPGERVIEEELSKKYQVSRGPVREALRQLEEEGLLTYVPHKGCIVKNPTEKEIEETCFIRSALEELAVSMYPGRMSESGIKKLREITETMEISADDRSRIVQLDVEFHEMLVEEAGSGKLLSMWKQLEGIYILSYYRMKKGTALPAAEILQTHEELLDLLAEGKDLQKAVDVLHIHNESVSRFCQTHMDIGGIRT